MLETGRRFDASNGWDAERLFLDTQKFFSTGQRVPFGSTVSFDDVSILPGTQQLIHLPAINTTTKITRNLPSLSLPILCGPSETVCGVNMAISVALAGGMGILHRNQSVESQVAMVKRVKQFQNGFILDPYVAGPNAKVADLDKIKEAHGCGCFPITDNGKLGGRLKGLVTSRDIETVEDRNVSVQAVMRKVHDLVVAKMPVQLRDLRRDAQAKEGQADVTLSAAAAAAAGEDAEDMLFKGKVGKLPIVDEDGKLMALLCRGDVGRVRQYPSAARDATRQLLVAASVGPDTREDWDRCQALIAAGADVLYVDTDDGVTEHRVEFIRKLKETHGQEVEIVAGRVSTVLQADALLSAGVDGLLVGCFAVGGGAEATCLYEIARHAKITNGVPVIADDVQDATQMFKAICLGASAVTMTSMLARCEEASGSHFYRDGARVRLHPVEVLGQASMAAGRGILGDPIVKKGIVGNNVDRGSARTLLPHLARTMRNGLLEIGAHTIGEAHNALWSGEMRMERQISQPKPHMSVEQHPRTMRLASSSLHNRW